MPTDDDTQRQAETTNALQEVVIEVFEQHRGASVETVRAALEDGIAAHGLDEQPEPWLESTATDLAAGRRVVLSPREEVDPTNLHAPAEAPDGSPRDAS